MQSGVLLHLRVPGYDVYNITAPVRIGEATYLFGRVERRESESDCRIFAFKLMHDESWQAREIPTLPPLQDPAIALIHDQIVLSGIRVDWKQDPQGRMEAKNWFTEFYSLDSQLSPNYLSRGPDGMKDIRLVGLTNGTLIAFGRPRTGSAPFFGGRISQIQLHSVADLGPQTFDHAKLLDFDLPDSEWIGANQALEVDGLVWVLGHRARWIDEQTGSREYEVVAFVFDPLTKRNSQLQTIVRRTDFPLTTAKRSGLEQVLFAGGFSVHDDLTIIVYTGISDSAAGKITVKNPFPKLVEDLLVHPVIPQD